MYIYIYVESGVVTVHGALFLEYVLSALFNHGLIWLIESWICHNRKILCAEFTGSFGKLLLVFVI